MALPSTMRSKTIDAQIPPMETAYQEMRPALFGALSKLAKQGFVASPSDSLDLIHDFFAEAWPGVTSNFDPSKGNFRSYAYGAFIHFVRPRIVRLQRLQNCLVSPEELARFHDMHSPTEEVVAFSIDEKALVRAFGGLSEYERNVLRSYINAEPVSERLLARKFFLSRYKLRELLIEALGRLILVLDVPFDTSQQDWMVARLLWRDRRSIPEAAAILGLTKQQVRNAAARNAERMARVLEDYQVKGSSSRRSSMSGEQKQQPATASQLLRDALLSPGNNDLLKMIHTRASEILATLDDSNSPGIEEAEIAAINPVWIAEVYEAISEGAGNALQPSEEHPDVVAALVALGEKDESAVGSAFRETLIADLPPFLSNFDEWFGAVPRIAEDEMKDALNTPAVRSGAPESHKLVLYGITPMTVFYTTEAMSGFVERLMRKGVVNSDRIFVRDSQLFAMNESGEELDLTERVIDEVVRFADCPSQTAILLVKWLLQVASYKPYLFSGFRFERKSNTQHSLVRTSETIENLYQRWSVGDTPARQLAYAE